VGGKHRCRHGWVVGLIALMSVLRTTIFEFLLVQRGVWEVRQDSRDAKLELKCICMA
jgi:hypothetical protein